METLIKIIKATSDLNRLKILKLLQKQPLCVCEIEALLPIAQPTVSIHLKVLANAKLIKAEKSGQWATYHLIKQTNPKLSSLIKTVFDYLDNDKEIVTLLKRIKKLRGKKACPNQ